MYQQDFYKCPFVLRNYALHTQFLFHGSGLSQPLSSQTDQFFIFFPFLFPFPPQSQLLPELRMGHNGHSIVS